jgi:hypothetical protein
MRDRNESCLHRKDAVRDTHRQVVAASVGYVRTSNSGNSSDMSILKKSSLAIAMATAFGLASPAMATTFGNTATPAQVAYTTVVGGNANISTQSYAVAIEAGDNQVGRTTGFNATLTLSGTAKFAVTPTVAVGNADAGWSVAVVSGGAGTNFVQVLVSPPSGGKIVTNDSVIVLSNVALSNASVLASVGGTVTLSGAMHDANTGFAVGTPFSGALVNSADALKVTYIAQSYQPNKKIDVGTGKVGFSDTGAILNNSSSLVYHFNAGQIKIESLPGLLNAADSSAFVFNNATDNFQTMLTGTFSKAFTGGGSIALNRNGCGSSQVNATVATNGSTATFAYTLAQIGVANPATDLPVLENVCFNANGSDVILSTGVNAGTTVDGGTAQNGTLLPLQYNGSVAFVPTFNPAGNTVQQSFLRVINPSSVGGKVTIIGTVDADQWRRDDERRPEPHRLAGCEHPGQVAS